MTKTESVPRCHYEVLGIDRDADTATIKKAHRKLALQYHPDKNTHSQQDDREKVAEQFRLVQEAYECLSDPAERRWYDDHREAILRGWSAGEPGTGESFLFDVEPYMYAGCYTGFDDDGGEPECEHNFYAVYRKVFAAVYDGESDGKSNADDTLSTLHILPRDFGTPHTPWEDVASFYQKWESFASCLNFAWADLYDINEAPNRRVRRAMEDENKKLRKQARKTRNDEILALVRFVKRRDPRVIQRRVQLDQERAEREKREHEEAMRKRAEAKVAREQWRHQTTVEMVAIEQNDMAVGRVRLADLDDDYDYGGKKGKNNKKKKGKQSLSKERVNSQISEESNSPQVEVSAELTSGNEVNESSVEHVGQETNEVLTDQDSSEGGKWYCECCKKDFKSEGQMDNHLQSKKHKVAWKKYESLISRLEQDIMNDLLDERT